MTTVYEELLRQYHGSDAGVLAIDPLYAVEWAFIPHFYRNFYVFQYATSIAGGTMFAERLLAGDESARDDYVAVLKAGGSRYAYELLKDYGAIWRPTRRTTRSSHGWTESWMKLKPSSTPPHDPMRLGAYSMPNRNPQGLRHRRGPAIPFR